MSWLTPDAAARRAKPARVPPGDTVPSGHKAESPARKALPNPLAAVRRLIHRLRLWWLDMTVEVLLDQRERVRADLIATCHERSDLHKRGIERGLA